MGEDWPYCNTARQLTSAIIATKDFSKWDELKYRRRLETFGKDDGPSTFSFFFPFFTSADLVPVIISGPQGEVDGICSPGELTDKGRETTLALGQRLRHLYVDQLAFMPQMIADSDMIYLRATPVSRALESVQQAFWGFYPRSARTTDFPPPTIVTRSPADETLYPNDASCKRFAQLSRAFGQRTADKWNDSEELEYLSKLYSKWMPGQARVAVDSKPRLTGILDTVNSTDAHGPETKLPKEFYDPKARAIVDKICVEEWYSGYGESEEYRMLGIGSLMGDIASRMIGSVERNGQDGLVEIGGNDGKLGKGRGGETRLKLALSGCHDTTLASVLTSLGAFDEEDWPPYTSHVAFELFRKHSASDMPHPAISLQRPPSPKSQGWWWSSFFGTANSHNDRSSSDIVRKPLVDLTEAQKDDLKDYYVRVRYNDKVMQVRGCKAPGKHLNDDTTICTLVR